MNILVLGGTRFVGKRLVNLLLEEGHEVTIGTRGKTETSFVRPVEHLVLDREDKASLAAAVDGRAWDVVYDQICYSPEDAAIAVEVLAGKTKRYIEVSTLSVYEESPERLAETAWMPGGYPVTGGSRHTLSYGEGKRQAEAVLWEQDRFEAVMVRFPIILGPDDYTKRLHFHVDKVLGGEPIGVPSPDARISFVHSAEAAAFLCWLKDSSLTGPVNCCSNGDVSIREVIGLVEKATGKTAVIREQSADEQRSPFGIGKSWHMDNSLAAEAGFEFYSLEHWLPELTEELAAAAKAAHAGN